MAVYERSCVVRAPLDDVWAFHTSVDGLPAVMPGWIGLTVEAVEPARDRLLEGSEVTLSIRPFGIGPRHNWTATLTTLERRSSSAVMCDEMRTGPFSRWYHRHTFVAAGDRTEMSDRVEYELPAGPTRALSWAAWPALTVLFTARHRATKRTLEA